MNQPLLSAASIFAAPDLQEETTVIPEWPNPDGSPGRLRLCEMDGERTVAMTAALGSHAQEDGAFIMLIFSAVDADGNQLFTMDDMPAVKKKSFKIIDRLQRICLRLNGKGKEEKEAQKKD